MINETMDRIYAEMYTCATCGKTEHSYETGSYCSNYGSRVETDGTRSKHCKECCAIDEYRFYSGMAHGAYSWIYDTVVSGKRSLESTFQGLVSVPYCAWKTHQIVPGAYEILWRYHVRFMWNGMNFYGFRCGDNTEIMTIRRCK